MKKNILLGLIVFIALMCWSCQVSEHENDVDDTEKVDGFNTTNPMRALKIYVNAVNSSCPEEIDVGLTNTKVVMGDNYVLYYFECDESNFQFQLSSEGREEMKKNVLSTLNDCDSTVNIEHNLIKNANFGVKYIFYSTADSSEQIVVTVEPDEIE